MRNIGGELELKSVDTESYFTDSGRSSLRLFLQSNDNRDKKYLLPDFFCEVIEKILIDENVEYSFYKVSEELLLDEEEILHKDFDVLYIVNYFGVQQKLQSSLLKDKIIIEDNVFFHNFENSANYKNWFAFNSFRKISLLSGGSLIKTNLELDVTFIKNENAPFIKLKNIAKNIKYEYINYKLFTEKEYLVKLEEAEESLNNQKEIFKIDNNLLANLITMDIKSQQEIRKIRFDILYDLFPQECINKNPSYYSFFVMCIQNRDDFRKNLMDSNIYLPIHWPQSSRVNSLYGDIISIPLFEIYTEEEFLYMLKKIEDSHEKL